MSKLDELVAVRVMGLTWYEDAAVMGWKNPDGTWTTDDDRDPPYSTDIAAAWGVVEKMESDGFRCDVSSVNPDGYPNWYAKFLRFTAGESPTYWMERADTASLAICLAALLAVGVPESEIQEATK